DILRGLSAAGVDVSCIAADASDESSLTEAIHRLQPEAGDTEMLAYNAVSPTFGKPTTLTPAKLVEDFRVNVAGGLAAALAVVPAMRARKSGCILFTGGGWAHYPWDEAASIGIGKAGLRNLAATLSQELAGDGVRVGMVSIMGQVAPGTPFDPAKIGEAFLRAYYSPANEFKSEVLFKGAA
ncbi:MAG: SDR family NAD(P)-dependent oxidoreductase, partial [Burkholderiales bacterium]